MKPLLITLLVFLTSLSLAQTTQETIDKAMGQCFQEQSLAPLTENYETVKDQPYWAAYNLYLQAAYEMKTKGEYADILSRAVKILNAKNDKSSEDYTLLAAISSMRMSTYKAVSDLMNGENTFYDYIEKALELDDKNPRAYYTAALYDYYKPVQYGGGRNAKTYMTKAVELFKNQTGDITWGANHAKQMLTEMK